MGQGLCLMCHRCCHTSPPPKPGHTHGNIPILQVKKLRLRARQRCAQGHVEVADLKSESRPVPLNKRMVPDTP